MSKIIGRAAPANPLCNEVSSVVSAEVSSHFQLSESPLAGGTLALEGTDADASAQHFMVARVFALPSSK